MAIVHPALAVNDGAVGDSHTAPADRAVNGSLPLTARGGTLPQGRAALSEAVASARAP